MLAVCAAMARIDHGLMVIMHPSRGSGALDGCPGALDRGPGALDGGLASRMAFSIAREVELCTRLRWLGRSIAWVAPNVFMPRSGAYRKTPARKLVAEVAVLGGRDRLRFVAAVFESPGTQPSFWITSAAHFCCEAPNALVLARPPCAPRDCGTTEAPRVGRTTEALRVGRTTRGGGRAGP